jgi:isopenicillin N synthase-like dioxygenase
MQGVLQVDLGDPGAAVAIDRACRDVGFFTVVGHGVPMAALERLDAAARAFFAQSDEAKSAFAMPRAGKAWRGWFPLGGELTSGIPDRKEGLYFGAEGDHRDPRPLHGANQFPPGLREPVLAWMAAMTALGQRLLGLLATGLGLDERWFRQWLTADPVTLFRIFHYPPQPAGSGGWGVAEHTDYGLLTILAQDGTGGLEVRAADGTWVDVPPGREPLVCNLGDMLEKLTAGRYRSTPHRVRNVSDRSRLSFPFFLDPSWDATVPPLQLGDEAGPAPARWDDADPMLFEGTYGEYLTDKVRRVFPELWSGVGAGSPPTMGST